MILQIKMRFSRKLTFNEANHIIKEDAMVE